MTELAARADVEALRAAGLRPTDVATLMKCHRVTASLWLKGESPHRLLWPKLGRLADAARLAVEQGSLPLGAGTRRDERAAMVAAALLPHISK